MTAAMHLLGAKPATWTPASLPNLALWLDAADAATITASSGLVSQWSDKSANANHVTASGTARPTTGANTQNGRNVLTFDGSSDVLVSGASIQDATITMYVACKPTADQSACPLFIGPRTSSGLTVGPYIDSSGIRDYPGSRVLGTGTWGATNKVVLIGSVSGTSVPLRARLNSTLYTTSTGNNSASTPASTDRVTVGSLSRTSTPFYFSGRIFEVAIFTDQHTTATIDLMFDYFAAKWGTT